MDAKVEPTQPGLTYLTTDQLAARIHYDARTIRTRMLDAVLIEGTHFIRPFGGRKLLFIWEPIERDMNAFSLDAKQRRAQGANAAEPSARAKAEDYSPVEDKFIRDHWGEMPTKEIAAALGRSQASINRRATKLGLSRPDEWTEPELALMRAHYVQEGAEAMALRLGRTVKAVQLQAVRMGLRRRPRFEPWTAAEDDKLREWAGKIPLARLHATWFQAPGKKHGQEFCRSYAAVAQRCEKLGLTLSRRDAALLGREPHDAS